MALVMDIDGVLDRAAVSAPGVISRKRTPTHNFLIFHCNSDGVFGTVVGKPFLTSFEKFRFFLISAGRVEDVMIVIVIDDLEIGFDGRPNSDGIVITS
jgi:hypothetical protein